jgi:hypothetical protein
MWVAIGNFLFFGLLRLRTLPVLCALAIGFFPFLETGILSVDVFCWLRGLSVAFIILRNTAILEFFGLILQVIKIFVIN